MKRWALVSGGIVANIVEQNTQPDIGGTWVDLNGAAVGTGWRYDGAAFLEPLDTRPRVITQYAFRQRFTEDERVDIELASLDVPTGNQNARRAAATLRVRMGDMAQAKYIDLALPAVSEALQAMESAGLLAPGRAATIVSDDVQGHERP